MRDFEKFNQRFDRDMRHFRVMYWTSVTVSLLILAVIVIVVGHFIAKFW